MLRSAAQTDLAQWLGTQRKAQSHHEPNQTTLLERVPSTDRGTSFSSPYTTIVPL